MLTSENRRIQFLAYLFFLSSSLEGTSSQIGRFHTRSQIWFFHEEEEEEEEEEADDGEEEDGNGRRREPEVKKVLQQEPEMLPCYASVSPLSPQLSSLGTPLLGQSIKVWDPYNVLSPLPSVNMDNWFACIQEIHLKLSDNHVGLSLN